MKSLTERDKRKIVQNVVGYLYIAPVLLTKDTVGDY